MMWLPCTHSLNTKGPVPTGALLYLFDAMSVPSYRCFGTIGDSVDASAVSKKGEGLLSTMTAVYGSGVFTSTTLAKVPRPRGWTCLSVRIEKATSAEVKSLPSCHFTPLRSSKVYCRPSLLCDHAVASSGLGLSS